MTTQDNIDPKTEEHICSVCNGEYTGWGNNAWPLNNGRCCDPCNGFVIARRMADIMLSRNNDKK